MGAGPDNRSIAVVRTNSNWARSAGISDVGIWARVSSMLASSGRSSMLVFELWFAAIIVLLLYRRYLRGLSGAHEVASDSSVVCGYIVQFLQQAHRGLVR